MGQKPSDPIAASTPPSPREQRPLLVNTAVRGGLLFFLMAIPLFLVTTNLLIVIHSGWLYTFGFTRHDVARNAGIEIDELRRVSDEIKAYFGSEQGPLHVTAVVDGVSRPLFNNRETVHMEDVKGLVRGLSFWQRVSLFYIIGAACAGILLLQRDRRLELLARGVFLGCALTLGIFLVAGVASLVGFETLFERFHVLSFSNDFWRLDPSTDYLVRVFPQGFFLDATLIVAGLTLGQALLAGSASALYLWRRRKAVSPPAS